MKQVNVKWYWGAVSVCLLIFSLLAILPTPARAAEMRISAPDEVVNSAQLCGEWAAWDDLSSEPVKIHWRNLRTGATGTVVAQGLEDRKSSEWRLGDGLVTWSAWIDGEDGGERTEWTEDFVTHERRNLYSKMIPQAGVLLKGTVLYQWEPGLLHSLDLRSGAEKTLPTSLKMSYDFDVDGDWLVWADFGDDPSDLGAPGTVHAWDLATGKDSVLGSVDWGNLQDSPPEVRVSGTWVTWNTDKSSREWDNTSAFAYDLATKRLIALGDRIGSKQNPHGVHASSQWLAWADIGNWKYIRGYVMDLTDPAATAQPVSRTPGLQYSTAISLPWVLWIDNRNAPSDYAVYVRLVTDAPAEAFSDIAESHDKEAIEALSAANIVGGYSDGTYRPDNTLFRAQFAKMLVGALGLWVVEGEEDLPFTDVERPDDNLYPDDYIAVAAANGIVNGFSPTRFGPYQPVTRIQMVSMIVRALAKLRPGRLATPPTAWKSSFPEATDPTHGRNVRIAEYNGLVANWGLNDETWSLWGQATRAEMARMLWCALGEEFGLPWTTAKAAISLAQLESQLRAQLDPGTSIYLPVKLPEGWAIAQAPLPPNELSAWSENPLVDPTGWYEVMFTNGTSLIALEARSGLGDPEPFTPDIPTGLRFEGREIDLLYCAHVPICYSFGTGEPRGWWLEASDPWSRDDVLAFAAAMKRVR